MMDVTATLIQIVTKNILKKYHAYGKIVCVNWPVGEMVNTQASQACIHGFKSRTGHHFEY
jgi:hypothetical protein